MVHLTLAGVSRDGTRLLLVDDTGEEFTLPIDAALRAALRGEHARLGQLEITMESALRPRDIQARIRAGETPDAVAAAASTTVDKIMPFANPVLAERAHVATRAQNSSVRRRGGDGRARTLGQAVAVRLRDLNVDPDTVEWDSWRREDGRWVLTAEFTTPERSGTARYAFDMPGNFVTSENDEARWLVGEEIAATEPAPADDLKRARARRQRPTPLGEQLSLGDDAIEMVSDEPAQPEETPASDVEQTADLSDELGHQRGVPQTPDESEADQPAAQDRDSDGDHGAPDTSHEPPAAPARRSVRKNRGRASVPSWDEIMFGGAKDD